MTKTCNLKSTQKTFYILQDKIASCCRAHPEQLDPNKSLNEYIQHWQTEAELLSYGNELVGCETCWHRERKQLPSFRTETLHNVPENRIELYLSNACNQQCSYCSPRFSSEWESSIKALGTFKNVSSTAIANQSIVVPSSSVDYWIDQINGYLDTCKDNSVKLILLGGEPLMQRSNLETFLNLNNSKIKILEIVTNLNPPNNKFLNYVLDSFNKNKLLFSISLDATPNWNHVPRGKFNSLLFEENFKLLKDYDVSYQFLTVLSVLNIFDIHNFINWTRKKVIYNILSNPVCLDVSSIPKEWRNRIWNNLESTPDVIQKQLLSESEPIDILLFEQYNYLKQYFQRVGIEPTKLPNQLFVDYWLFLEKKFQ